MGADLVDEALANAKQMLASDLKWIAESSFQLRAFYWGIYCGLGSATTDDDRSRIVVRAIADTMFGGRPGDDPFMSTQIGTCYERIRQELRRHVETDRHIRAVREENARRKVLEPLSSKPDIQEPPAVPIEHAPTLLKPLLELIQELAERWRHEFELVHAEIRAAIAENSSSEKTLETLDHFQSSIRFLADPAHSR
jgi:hypothetical protein